MWIISQDAKLVNGRKHYIQSFTAAKCILWDVVWLLISNLTGEGCHKPYGRGGPSCAHPMNLTGMRYWCGYTDYSSLWGTWWWWIGLFHSTNQTKKVRSGNMTDYPIPQQNTPLIYYTTTHLYHGNTTTLLQFTSISWQHIHSSHAHSLFVRCQISN